MPELETEHSAELLMPVAEPAPEMASPGLSPVVPGIAGTGGVGSRFGDIALMSGVQEPPPEAVASLLGHPRYGLPANAPQKTRLLIGLQQRYGNAYMRQVMTLVRQESMAAAAPAEAAVVGTEETAPSQAYGAPAPTPAPMPSGVEAAVTPPLPPSPISASTPEPAPPTGAGPAGMQAPTPSPETAPATPPVTMSPMTSDAGIAAEAEASLGGAPAAPSVATAGAAAAAPPAVGEGSGMTAALSSETKARPEAAAGEAAEAAVGKEIPRVAATPGEDPAFQKATEQVHTEAKTQKRHPRASKKRQEAEQASALTDKEQIVQSSKERNTEEMEQVGAKQQNEGQKFSAEQFKNDLKARISAVGPQTESQAKAFAQEPPVKHFEGEFSKNVALEQSKVTGPLEQQARPEPTGGVVEKLTGNVPAPIAPPAPKPVDPKLATPKPKTDQEISLQHEGDRLDAAMKNNRLSDEQLSESREPSFLETLSLKQKAQQKVAEAPDEYRQRESAVLQGAEGQTDRSLSTELAGMSQTHHKIGSHVFGGQKATETKTEKRQRDIKKTIDDIYKGTVDGVQSILADMAKRVKERFANSLKQQTEIFNNNVKRRISDYYGDWRIDDKLLGPADVVVEPDGTTRPLTFEESFGRKAVKRINPDVYKIFVEEKDRFISAMDTELDTIADNVQDGLNAAHTLIKLGKLNIAIFKATLQGEELTYASQLEEEVKLKFENLEGSIDDAREDLLQTLADEYSENVKQLEITFNDINNELKKSWVDRAIEFVVGVAKAVYNLGKLLLSIVSRIAGMIDEILAHPIRFLENLAAGIKQGFATFIDSIDTYLLKGFFDWLRGSVGSMGFTLPDQFDEKGLFGLATHLIGLNVQTFKEVVVRKLGAGGERIVAVLEKGEEILGEATELFRILKTEGIGGLWTHLKEMILSHLSEIFNRIKETVLYETIKKALMFVASLFTPVGAFIKAVQLLYAGLKFLMDNIERIAMLVNAFLDSLELAVKGETGGIANKIITVLSTFIVVGIDFLAKLLNLGNLADKVRKIIQALKVPVIRAMEWLVDKLIKPALNAAQKAGKVVLQAGVPQDPNERLRLGLNAAATAVNALRGPVVTAALINPVLTVIKVRYGFKTLQPVESDGDWWVEGEVNPKKLIKTQKRASGQGIGIPETYVKPTGGSKARSLTAEPLTKKPGNTTGSEPSEDPPGWEHVRKIDRVLLNPETDQYGPRFWRRMHLLSEKLHGPGKAWNLVPAVEKHNSAMKTGPEADAKVRIANEEVLYYDINVKFYSGEIAEDFPSSVQVDYGSMRYKDGKWTRAGRINGLSMSPAQPPLKSTSKISINTLGRDILYKMGLPYGLAESIAAESPYRDQADLRSKMQARYTSLSRPVDFNQEYWPTVRAFISSNKLTF